MTTKRAVSGLAGWVMVATLALSACGGGSGQPKASSGDAGSTDNPSSATTEPIVDGTPLQSVTCPTTGAAGAAVGSGVKLEIDDHRPVAYNCNYVRDDSGTADGDINYSAQGKVGFDNDIDELRQTADTDLTSLSGYGDEAFMVHVKDLVHEEYYAYALFGGSVTINAKVSSDHTATVTAAKAKALLDVALTTAKGIKK
jgi:hypothetical protein